VEARIGKVRASRTDAPVPKANGIPRTAWQTARK
jgi:hypothetical protein